MEAIGEPMKKLCRKHLEVKVFFISCKCPLMQTEALWSTLHYLENGDNVGPQMCLVNVSMLRADGKDIWFIEFDFWMEMGSTGELF